MTHTETVNQQTYKALQGTQRHLIVKTDPLIQPGDTLMIRQAESREELEFRIESASTENINQKGGLTLLSLYAPYTLVDDIPDSVGGGAKMHNDPDPEIIQIKL